MRYSSLFAFGFIVDFGAEFNVAIVVDFDIAFFSLSVMGVGCGSWAIAVGRLAFGV